MRQEFKIWKISLLLLLGLLISLYLIASTVADAYWVITNPVAGVEYEFNSDLGRMIIHRVVPQGPAGLNGLRENDVILTFNRKPIFSESELNEAYGEIKVGQKVNLTISRDNQEFNISFVADRRLSVYTQRTLLHSLPAAIFCYALCLIGTFVFLKRIEDRSAHIFYLMLLFWALAMRGAWEIGPTLKTFLPRWVDWLRLPAWPLAVGLLWHFFLIFPVEKDAFKKHPKPLLVLMYLPAILVIPAIYADIQNLKWGEKLLNYGWGIWLTLNFTAGMIALDHSIRKAPNPHIKKQAQIMAWGTALSLAIPLCFYFLPKLLFDQTLPFGEFTGLLIVLWPVTLAYVIVKHRFMDIDVIVKRGVAYALTSGVVVAAYFLLVVGAGKLVLYLTGSTSQIATIIATLVIAALFNPVKNRIRKFVDRRFYPRRFTYREAIQAFGHELVNVVDLQKLLDLLKSFFLEKMQIRPVALLMYHPSEQKFLLQTITEIKTNSAPSFSWQDKAIQHLQERRRLIDFSPLKEQADFFSEDESRRWETLEAELAIPLLSKGELVGVIALGAKEGDEPYYKEDLEMLATLGDQINISLTNTFLTEELREQDRLKRELEVARRMQLSTLPQKDPQIPGLEISGISIPAFEVGGDYYDYINFSDGRFGVIIGDVSGKGTSAAFYMSTLKGILKTASKYHRSLKDLMVEVNAVAFQSLDMQSYITLMFGAFDIKRHKLHLVRAGHLPLVYYSAKKQICRQLLPKGIGVGLEDGHIFKSELEEVVVKFDPGDVFLFFTDGITEARDALGNELDLDLLMNTIQKNGWSTAATLREKIISQVHEFAAGASAKDDMTLVVVKVGAPA